MFHQLSQLVARDPLAWTTIAFLAGTLIGARLNYSYSLELARRKEFNAVAERIVPMLESELENLHPSVAQPTPGDFRLISHKLKPWRREGFRSAVRRYQEAHDEHSVVAEGSWILVYTDDSHIKASINEVLGYLEYW